MSASQRIQEFAQQLRARGIIAADAAAPPDIEEPRPWFLALLQAVAGWLAGICVLVFLGLLFKPDSKAAIFGLGIALLVAAWIMYRADRHAVFLDQFALALSVAGQLAVAWVMFDALERPLPTSAALLVLQIAVFLIMPNKMARTLAALFACVAWVFTVRFLLRPGAGEEIFFQDGAAVQFPLLGAWSVPVGWIATWAPIVAAAWWLVRSETRWMASPLRVYARPALAGLLLGASLAAIWTEPFSYLAMGVADIGLSFNLWALFPLLSIAVAMFAAFQAYRVRSFGLLGIAIIAALVHLSRFYYLYGTTLLWKSAIMLVAGVLLLAAGVLCGRRAREAA